MKIRTGFVSNSSSSSFVIYKYWVDGEFEDALDVARHMIPQRGYKNDQKLVKKTYKLGEKLHPDEVNAVCFNSCNYDTFIVKMDNKFLISTCNNHEWTFPSGTELRVWPREYEQYWGVDFYDLQRRFDFLHLDYDFVGRKTEWDLHNRDASHCPRCHADNWIVEGKIVCPNCKCNKQN